MPDPITSLQNPRIKEAIRLRTGSNRRGSGKVIVDGLREFSQAIAAGLEVQAIFLPQSSSSIRSLLFEPLSQLANRIATSAGSLVSDPSLRSAVGIGSKLDVLEKLVTPVTEPVFEKLAFGQRESEIVAIVSEPDLSLLQLQPRSTNDPAVVLVIDRVEKPGNIGAMLRTADAAGADAVILCDPISDPWNSNTIRSSLGTIFRLPMAAGRFKEVLHWLKSNQFQILAARVDGSVDYRRFPWPDQSAALSDSESNQNNKANRTARLAIVVGSEAEGLGGHWNVPEVQAVRLPMRGAVDSLNVSVTAAVLLFEAKKNERRD